MTVLTKERKLKDEVFSVTHGFLDNGETYTENYCMFSIIQMNFMHPISNELAKDRTRVDYLRTILNM